MYFLLALLSSVAAIDCPGSDTSYKIKDKAILCFYLGEVDYQKNTTSYESYGDILGLELTVDEYSAVRLNNSYSELHSANCPNSDNTTYTNCSMFYGISVSYGVNKSTPYAPYLKETHVSKVFSAVVTLEDGKVKKIEWDNACDICDEVCVEWNDEEICGESQCDMGKEGDCDPRIYISWIGTDSSGNNLLSASYRISQFRKYSIMNLYSQAKKKF